MDRLSHAAMLQRTKSLTGGTWNEVEQGGTDVERRDLQLGAFVLAASCQASDRSAEAVHGSLPCVPCVPRGLARLLSLVSLLSLTPSVPQLRNCACQFLMEQAEQGSNNESWTIQTCHHWGSPFRSSHRYGKKNCLPSEAAASMQGSPGSDEKWRKTLLGQTPKNFS